MLRPAQEELAPGRGNSKPVASGSRAGPWLGPRQPGNRLLSNFLAIQRACSEPQFHFPLPASQPKRQGTPEATKCLLKSCCDQGPPKLLHSGTQSGAAAVPPVASGGGESRGNLLGPALGLPGSFCSLPEKSSNKAAQRQDTGSFQPSLTAVLEARLWPDPLRSGPVWPNPPLQTGAGTNPAKEVVKAPVLQGFPEPWPACCWEESPRDAALALSYCPSELPICSSSLP